MCLHGSLRASLRQSGPATRPDAMKAAILSGLLPLLLVAAAEDHKLGAMRDFFDALGVPRMEAMDVQEAADRPGNEAIFGNGDDQYDTSTLRLLHVVSTGPGRPGTRLPARPARPTLSGARRDVGQR